MLPFSEAPPTPEVASAHVVIFCPLVGPLLEQVLVLHWLPLVAQLAPTTTTAMAMAAIQVFFMGAVSLGWA